MTDTRRILNSAPACKALAYNGVLEAVRELSTTGGGLGTLLADLEHWRVNAERVHATAPVAAVLAAVLSDLRAVAEPAAVASVPDHRTDNGEGRLLTPQQAAEQLGVSVRWLYRHSGKLPFVRRLTRRSLRFDRVGLERWVASRRP